MSHKPLTSFTLVFKQLRIVVKVQRGAACPERDFFFLKEFKKEKKSLINCLYPVKQSWMTFSVADYNS